MMRLYEKKILSNGSKRSVNGPLTTEQSTVEAFLFVDLKVVLTFYRVKISNVHY